MPEAARLEPYSSPPGKIQQQERFGNHSTCQIVLVEAQGEI
jgi:hypothetical protein